MDRTALIIGATAPLPVDNGKRAVLNGLLTYFVDRLGADAVHYAVLGGADQVHPALPGVVHRLDKPGTAEQLLTLRRCAGSGSYTVQEAMLGAASLRDRIQDLVRQVRPTIEVYDTLRLGQHAPADFRSTRRVLYLDDLFSVRYQRILDVAEQGGMRIDPLGGFVENVPGPLRSLARRPAVYKPLLRFERDRIRRREAEIVADFDVSLLVNSREVDELRSRAGSAVVEAMTPLMPPVTAPRWRPARPPEFVFLGKLDIPHNDDAICHFLRSAMPVLARRHPGSTVRIIGRNPSPMLQALAARHPGRATLEGYVPDLDEALSRASVLLAPLRFGSGVKIKVLEALGRGVPVLGTTTAAEGIPAAADGADGFLVSDDVAAWPDLLTEMVDRGPELSEAALDFFDRTYSQQVVFAQYDALFGLTPAPGVAGLRRAS